jgi:hypothetical protein
MRREKISLFIEGSKLITDAISFSRVSGGETGKCQKKQELRYPQNFDTIDWLQNLLINYLID